MKALKKELYDACRAFVTGRSETVRKIISSHQHTLISETKSSAGDKHETGRAMLQLEMEKAGQQLAAIDEMDAVLNKMTLGTSGVVKIGSLVLTNRANYFLAISAGELIIGNTSYYAISPSSPIGKLLLGNKVGHCFTFNHNIEIQNIY